MSPRNWGVFSWHWFFMVQPYPTPEDDDQRGPPEIFIRPQAFEKKPRKAPAFFDPPRAFGRIYSLHQESERTVYGMCEDYRATFGVDLDMDTCGFRRRKESQLPPR